MNNSAFIIFKYLIGHGFCVPSDPTIQLLHNSTVIQFDKYTGTKKESFFLKSVFYTMGLKDRWIKFRNTIYQVQDFANGFLACLFRNRLKNSGVIPKNAAI